MKLDQPYFFFFFFFFSITIYAYSNGHMNSFKLIQSMYPVRVNHYFCFDLVLAATGVQDRDLCVHTDSPGVPSISL